MSKTMETAPGVRPSKKERNLEAGDVKSETRELDQALGKCLRVYDNSSSVDIDR